MRKPDTNYTRKMLCTKLAVTNVDRQCYPCGFCTSQEVITSNRYILILSGSLEYEVEGVTKHLERGSMIFVPAWVRRRWYAPGNDGCENIWCEFSSLSLEIDRHSLFFTQEIDPRVELGSLSRMHAIWKKSRRKPSYFPDLGHAFCVEHTEDPLDLQLEGELKASLSRFWTYALCQRSAQTRPLHHPEIRRALRLLETSFSQYDALEALYGQLGLTPNYFRTLFKEQMQVNPRDFLHGLRMRHARHLVQHSKRSVKDIAYSVGFRDPLYFSRQYTAFWGTSPRTDRHISK